MALRASVSRGRGWRCARASRCCVAADAAATATAIEHEIDHAVLFKDPLTDSSGDVLQGCTGGSNRILFHGDL